MTSQYDVDTAELRKARGAFFTPPEVCDAVTTWAIRSPLDAVMEPSCGEAAFLTSATKRLRSVGAASVDLTGFELHDYSAEEARRLLGQIGVTADIQVGDFLQVKPVAKFDAVVGNPPFIRYQGFSGASRDSAIRAAAAQGVRLTNLASSWAAFVVHSAAFLKPAGRLGLVLPAELLSSNYAADIRTFLLRRFRDVRVVLFDHHVFPGVQTEALLLLAEGTGPTDKVTFARVSHERELADAQFTYTVQPTSSSSKWTTALVATSATSALNDLSTRGLLVPLGDAGRISLGAVTGNNKWFALSRDEVVRLGLKATDLTRISPPGSTHLRTGAVTKSDWTRLDQSGARTLLFTPGKTPSTAAQRYISAGEQADVHLAYKCRVRPTWWRVPIQAAPDLMVTCMNAQTPQIAANPTGLRHLNSVHGLYLNEANRPFVDVLGVAALNSATMLSAEIVGRSYGGGILKLEPREAAALATPSTELLAQRAQELRSQLPTIRKILKAGRLGDAVGIIDDVMFGGTQGDADAVIEMRRARNLLAHRRQNRARGPRKE